MSKSVKTFSRFTLLVFLVLLLPYVSSLLWSGRISTQRLLSPIQKKKSTGLLFFSSTVIDPDVSRGSEADGGSLESLTTVQPTASDIDNLTKYPKATKKNYSFGSRLPRQTSTEEIRGTYNSENLTNNIQSSPTVIEETASETLRSSKAPDAPSFSRKGNYSFGTRLRRRAEIQRASAPEVLKQSPGYSDDSSLLAKTLASPEISRSNYFYGIRSRRAASSAPVAEEDKDAVSFEVEEGALPETDEKIESAAVSLESIGSTDEITSYSTSIAGEPAVVTDSGTMGSQEYPDPEVQAQETTGIPVPSNLDLEASASPENLSERPSVRVNYSFGARSRPATPPEPAKDESNFESAAQELSVSDINPRFFSDVEEGYQGVVDFFDQKQEIVSFSEDDEELISLSEDDEIGVVLVEDNDPVISADTRDTSSEEVSFSGEVRDFDPVISADTRDTSSGVVSLSEEVRGIDPVVSADTRDTSSGVVSEEVRGIDPVISADTRDTSSEEVSFSGEVRDFVPVISADTRDNSSETTSFSGEVNDSNAVISADTRDSLADLTSLSGDNDVRKDSDRVTTTDNGNQSDALAIPKNVKHVEMEIRATTYTDLRTESESALSKSPIDLEGDSKEASTTHDVLATIENNAANEFGAPASVMELGKLVNEETLLELDQTLSPTASQSFTTSFAVKASEDRLSHHDSLTSYAEAISEEHSSVEVENLRDESLRSHAVDTEEPISESSALEAMDSNTSYVENVKQTSLALSHRLDTSLDAEIARSALWYASMALRR